MRQYFINLFFLPGISAKQISSTFFRGELEHELRSLGQLDMFQLMKVDGNIDTVLAEIERLRRVVPYEHNDCHPDCQAKGTCRCYVEVQFLF